MSEQFNESAFHESDILFWSEVISKHIWYIGLSLEKLCYKEQANLIYCKWREFIPTLPTRYSCDGYWDYEVYGRSKENYITGKNVDDFNTLNNSSRYFVRQILNDITNCVQNYPNCPKAWYGFAYPSYLESVLRRIAYAKAKVNCDDICDNTTVKFWNKNGYDNLFTIIHLLDPSEHQFIQIAYKLAWRFKKNLGKEDCKSFEKCARENAKKLDELFRTFYCLLVKNDIRSIIHPAFLNVLLREGQRALKDITWLYCDKRKKCCKDTNECCLGLEDFEKYVKDECNKCCKDPEPIRVKKCKHE